MNQQETFNPFKEPNRRVKTLPAAKADQLTIFANFHKSGSIRGMKKMYYGKGALLVRCGSYVYNVTPQPNIYFNQAY